MACLAGLLVLAGCSARAQEVVAKAPTIPGVAVFSGLSHKHVFGHVDYPQAPPVGGPHAHYPLACAVYGMTVPNEFAVHSVEHGAVWLTYQPGIPTADLDALGGLALLRSDYVLVSPYPGQPSRIEATAWGLQLAVTDAQDPRLKAFVQQYAGGGQGGEPGATCKDGVTPEQALALYKP